MFRNRKKKDHEFGWVSPGDDRSIEIIKIPKEARRSFWLEGIRFFRDVFLIITVFILLGVFAVQPVVVEGTSMLPQLHDGERLLVNKLVNYRFYNTSWSKLERGDIVVFWYPNDPDKSYVKRIIGLPGETIEIKNGKVWIDGELLNESYLDTEHNQFPRGIASNMPRKVEPHHYFVMGDNRDNSSDSRDWGFVPERYIYGKAFFRYWQPRKIGFLEHGRYEAVDATPGSDTRAVQEH
jgi:signal peptidase I